MTGRLQLCYLMCDLSSKLQVSILPILFKGKPLYGWNLPHVGWMLQRLATQIWQLSKVDRLRSMIILVWPIKSKMEQEISTGDGCLAFLQHFLFLSRCSWLCNIVNWPLSVKQKRQTWKQQATKTYKQYKIDT